jgi:hypothetical protein
MRAGWSAGLDVLAKAVRNASSRISAHSRESAEPRGTQSRVYESSRRPSLQRSAPVTSVSPSANGNVVHLPLDSFDIGTFLRELDALRRCMTEAAPAFDRTGEKCGATVAPRERHHASTVDAASLNDALARAVKRLGKSSC